MVRTCTGEFKASNCGFEHLPPDDFVKSQWQSRTKSLPYLIYRIVIAAIFTLIVISSMISASDDIGRYFIYLTNWGITLCMITTVLGAILVAVWYYHPEYSDIITDTNDMPTIFKVYWALHNISLILSLMITIIYWSLLYKPDKEIDAVNLLTHAFNSIIMLSDKLIIAHPIRLLHFIQPTCFGLFYVAFSLIFFWAGGVDKFGNAYIYNVLDWSTPGDATITVVGTILLGIFIHILIFYVYKIRSLIYSRCCKKESFLPTTATLQTMPNSGISMVFGHDNEAFYKSTDKIAPPNKY